MFHVEMKWRSRTGRIEASGAKALGNFPLFRQKVNRDGLDINTVANETYALAQILMTPVAK